MSKAKSKAKEEKNDNWAGDDFAVDRKAVDIDEFITMQENEIVEGFFEGFVTLKFGETALLRTYNKKLVGLPTHTVLIKALKTKKPGTEIKIRCNGFVQPDKGRSYVDYDVAVRR